MSICLRRREFIVALGGAAVWPVLAHAQQGVRRVGVLTRVMSDSAPVPRILRNGLQGLGWIEGRNLRLDVRGGGGDPDLNSVYAAELVRLKPDVIVTGGLPATRAVQQRTQNIPIVFLGVGDPVAAGIVKSMAHPEGNATGITNGFSSMGGKWVQLLKEAVPRIERIADLYNPLQDSFSASTEAAARALGLQAIRIPYRNAVDFERAIAEFAAVPNGGLIVQASAFTSYTGSLLFGLVAKHRLPAICQSAINFSAVVPGVLMSYGLTSGEIDRRLVSHVDHILRGAKPGDLPVEFPTKFDLVINLKAAEAIGISFPPSLIALADKVIE
jgi:putative ABC transport system substrate-binding protein